MLTHVDKWLATNHAELVALRHHLHANPELSGHEHATASYLCQRLAAAGFQPRWLEPGRNGVICEIGTGPLTIGYRADIDALPTWPDVETPYQSTREGVSHACGHDLHTTAAYATLLALRDAPMQLPAKYRFLFQPSEEIKTAAVAGGPMRSGAEHMVAAGEGDDLDYLYAFHAWPGEPVGTVELVAGDSTANNLVVEVELHGPGGHTARAAETLDIIRAYADIASQVPGQLDERLHQEGAAARVAFGQLSAGAGANVLPLSGRLVGTVRYFGHVPHQTVATLFREAVLKVLADGGHLDVGSGAETDCQQEAGGACVHFRIARHATTIYHDPAATHLFGVAAAIVGGPDAVKTSEPSWGGDDIGDYHQSVTPPRLVMPRLYVGGDRALHQAGFDAGDDAISPAVRILTTLAVLTPLIPKSPNPWPQSLLGEQPGEWQTSYSVDAQQFTAQRQH